MFHIVQWINNVVDYCLALYKFEALEFHFEVGC